MGNNPVKYVDPDGRDITIGSAFNLDFGNDYLLEGKKSWDEKNYGRWALCEVDAFCEIIYDGIAAYCGAKALGIIVDGIGSLLSPDKQLNPSGSSVAMEAGQSHTTTYCANLGNKLDYLYGKASGSIHNIERSLSMQRSLERIGLSDTPASRTYITGILNKALNDSTSIKEIQETGRIVRESILSGPNGVVKMVSIWENTTLITVELFGGN